LIDPSCTQTSKRPFLRFIQELSDPYTSCFERFHCFFGHVAHQYLLHNLFMEIAHDENPNSGPDWEASVTTIPDGILTNIESDPFNTGGFYGDIYLGYHKGLGLKVALKRPRSLSGQDIRVCPFIFRIVDFLTLPEAIFSRESYLGEGPTSEHTRVSGSRMAQAKNSSGVSIHDWGDFGSVFNPAARCQ
jgi:hypothetical protein